MRGFGPYRIGFELTPVAGGETPRAFIDHDRPRSGVGALMSRLLGERYARWRVQRMLLNAQRAQRARLGAALRKPLIAGRNAGVRTRYSRYASPKRASESRSSARARRT